MIEINRRSFLAGATAATAVLASPRPARATAASDKVVLAIMGANNRGSQLATVLAKIPGAEIAYICDCDENAVKKGIEAATSQGGRAPKGIKDFRQALDDRAVDGLVLRRSQSLARNGHHSRLCRRQTRVQRKAGKPHGG